MLTGKAMKELPEELQRTGSYLSGPSKAFICIPSLKSDT